MEAIKDLKIVSIAGYEIRMIVVHDVGYFNLADLKRLSGIERSSDDDNSYGDCDVLFHVLGGDSELATACFELSPKVGIGIISIT